MFRILSLCLLLVCLASTGLSATIRSIAIRQDSGPTVEQAFVRTHLVSKVGDTFDPFRLTRDVEALYDTGRFSYVGVELASPRDQEEVDLVYHIRARLLLEGSPSIIGNDKLRDGKVQDLLNLDRLDLIDDQILAVRAQKVRDEYRDKLFPDAKVTWEIRELTEPKGHAEVTFTIDEGKKSKIGSVTFDGNEVYDDGDLRPHIKTKRLLNPFSWFARQPYEPDHIDLGLDAIRDQYRNSGYLDVKVGEPEILRKEDSSALDLKIQIDEGRAYSFGKVTVEGVSLFPNVEIENQITAVPGEVASMSTISKSRDNVQLFYGNRGYINADAFPVFSADEKTGEVDVIFRVTEGQLVKIRNIYIRGNTVTRDKVARRELRIYPGDDYHLAKVRQSEANLRRLGFFAPQSVVSFPEPLADPNERDLVFRVEEKRTGQFMVGAGFSSVDKVLGYMEFQQSNFDLFGWPPTGGGQKLKLSLSSGSRRNEYVLSFIEPWFRNKKRELGIDLFRRDLSYPDYDATRAGFKVRYGMPLPWGHNNRVTATYQLQNVEVTDVADTNEYFLADGTPFFFSTDQDELQSTVGLGFKHDTRDNFFVPTDGLRVRLNGEMTGGPFGGEADFYEVRFDVDRHFPVWLDHVVSVKGQYHVIDPFGDYEDISILDRFYLGGGRTLRGFEWRDVGPKAFREDELTGDLTHRPVGGRTRAVATVEYTIPISEGLRFAMFVDAGNVYEDAFSSDFSEYAASAGVGIRLDMPGFPIRLDIAQDLRKDDEFTETDAWSFNIGF